MESPEAGGRIIGVACELPTDIQLINMLTCESVLLLYSGGESFLTAISTADHLAATIEAETLQSNPASVID